MIIICNGAFKSGSTWLLNIARQLNKPDAIGEEWQNPKWNNPSIDPDKMKSFIQAHRGKDGLWISKNHLEASKFVKLLTKTFQEDVKILNIRRDIRDVVVSAYHHYKRVNDLQDPFEVFYAKRGVKLAGRVCGYNKMWDTGTPNNHFTSYEALHTSGVEEIKKIADFLELDVTDEFIKEVQEKTSFASWKERSKSGHLRKGIIGDWHNYLTAEDVEKLRAKLDPDCFSELAD